MKLEYSKDDLILKVLDTSYSADVFNFYYYNREEFDKYETDKPGNFYTLEFIENILQAEFNAFLQGTHIRFFLFDRTKPDTIIGTISFTSIKGGAFRSCITGYKIDKRYQNLGYGQRMLTMALKIMVTEHHMHRIEAYISPDNKHSISLATKLGFINEGTAYSYVYMRGSWHDHLRYVYIS